MLFPQRLSFVFGIISLCVALLFLGGGAPPGVVFLMGVAAVWAFGSWLFILLGMPEYMLPKWCNIAWWICIGLMLSAAMFQHVLFTVLFGVEAFLIAVCKIRSKRAQN